MTTPAPRAPAGRLARLLEHAPEAAASVTQIIVDNPAPLTLTMAGSIVVSKMLLNAVRPRGPVEDLAVIIVASALCGAGARELVKRGWLNFRVRDQHGCLVPLEATVREES